MNSLEPSAAGAWIASAAYIGVPGAQLVLFVDPSDTLPTAPPLQPSLGAGEPSGF